MAHTRRVHDGGPSRRAALGGAGAALLASILPGCDRGPHLLPVTASSGADRAVEAARSFAGRTLRVGWESGAQADEVLRQSGPRWEELTGIRVQVVEMGTPAQQFRYVMAEHGARSGALDCASIAPAWLPDLTRVEALLPLDERVAHYLPAADLEDYLPGYRALGVWEGRRYGLFDDGDVLLLYWRRDLFEDPEMRAAFEARHGRPLPDPRSGSWSDFTDAAAFFTQPALGRYGLAPFTPDLWWSWYQCLLRQRGETFFEEEGMRANVGSPVATRLLADLVGLRAYMPPTTKDSVYTTLATWLAGNAAMATFWPPLGRWAEGYGAPPWGGVPPSQVIGRTGYALLPGGVTELSVGFVLSVLSGSKEPDAAYLFIQWLTSPTVSLNRVMAPFALRDPYRVSHVTSPAFRALWPNAGAYLDTLREGSARMLPDLTLPGTNRYAAAFQEAWTRLLLGAAPEHVGAEMARDWDAITDDLGVSAQRVAWRAFLGPPAASPDR
ncbi:MAG: extracellular solute-binding protein [Pseudomonadota bacterium]|nr:extracellular solute-binding protein [Pseudomonadota bacterium]